MATDFTDLPVNLAGRTVYATTANFSEGIQVESLESYGILGTNGAFNTKAVEASASASFYLMNADDLTTFTALAKSSAPQTINIGGNQTTKAYLVNLGISVSSDSAIQVSTSWIYFGNSSTASATAPAATISPAIAQKASIVGYNLLGGGSNSEVFSFDYGLSQTYNTHYYLANLSSPVIVWANGEETASIEGYELTSDLLAATPCPALEGEITLSFADCNGVALGSIALEGYSVERGLDINTNEVASNNVNLQKFL